jgi:4-alpha-glucanotransferase
MAFERSSGILLHPTSLPGRYGIGDLGDWSFKFVDYLIEIGQKVWQMLPLGPTSYGDSPYQTLSAFAGSPFLISLDRLVEEGWLSPEDVAEVPPFPDRKVDFGSIIPYHNEMLARAYQNFASNANQTQAHAFNEWIEQNKEWLDDFALFASLKAHHGGKPWVEWDEGEALRQPEAMLEANKRHQADIREYSWLQWIFFRQWLELKAYANGKGIQLIGDIPIFVAHDSSDVWANPQLFYLDEKGYPTVVAGVPPDYFSETGQRWGNPLYRWEEMDQDGYSWWVRRIRASLDLVDVIRIDHFRGFAAYWEVPASEPTAVRGQWTPGPGKHFFDVIQAALGKLPIIAEDLGVITPDVVELRDAFNLPGMKILQFAWAGGVADPFLPHNHVPNCIVYSGTHDNNTTIGWWHEEATPDIKEFVNSYFDHEVHEINWELLRAAEMSVAHTCVVPMQDILNLGADARMNLPGREAGNWTWRCVPEDFDHPGKARLLHYTRLYGR